MKLIKNLNAFMKISSLKNWNFKFSKEDINAYFSQINIPILPAEQSQTCKGAITEFELLNHLERMASQKNFAKLFGKK